MPGGGLAPDGRWIGCKPTFFLPVKPLARLFRRLFLDGLVAAHKQGRLYAFGNLAALTGPRAFADRIADLRKIDWLVYAKPPFGGPAQVLAYLACYTHRAAITNTRLVAVEADHVAFTYKDYRREGRRKIMRLAPDALIHRFLLHLLPDGFHRIRHDGFLANGQRAAKIARCRKAIAALPAALRDEPAPATKPFRAVGVMVCRDCGGPLRRLGDIAPMRPRAYRCDTS